MNFIFIDLDGTIEDSRQDMVDAGNAVRKQFDLAPRTYEALAPHVTKGMDHLYRNIFSEMFTQGDASLSKIQQAYDQYYLEHVAIETKLYEGMSETLKQISNTAKIIVITNKPENISRHLLKKLSVGSFITDVMGGDSCAEIKPNPLPMQIAAKKYQYDAKKDKAVMVGDSQADMEIAARFGIKSIWCAWGYAASAPQNPAPYFTAQRPLDLVNIVNEL